MTKAWLLTLAVGLLAEFGASNAQEFWTFPPRFFAYHSTRPSW